MYCIDFQSYSVLLLTLTLRIVEIVSFKFNMKRVAKLWV